METILDNRDDIINAFGYTLALFLFSGVLSLIFGTILAGMRVGPVPIMRRAAGIYVTIVRNTPLIMVVLFFRIAAPKLGLKLNFIDVDVAGLNLDNLWAACAIGLTVYTSSFVCEAIRSGVNAVALGQAEAARAIGLPFTGVMREVVLPQAIRACVPPLASVQIALLKNTTVCGAVGVFEAFARMRTLTNKNAGDRIEIFLVFALVFVILVEVISFGANRLERRWRVASA